MTTTIDAPPQLNADQYKLPQGRYEEAVAMIGARCERAVAEFEINWPMIKLFCGVAEDANRSYWDEDFATAQWSGIVSPPAMVQLPWLMPLPWKPGGESWPRPALIATSVPLPGTTMINAESDVEYLRPVLVGQRLAMQDELAAVSPLRETPIGAGHFVTTIGEYRTVEGELVARATGLMFRYTPGAGASTRSRRAVSEGEGDSSKGEPIPPIEIELSHQKVILGVAATQDFFPGHCDPEYARAQGARAIFSGTPVVQAIVDRAITDWSGPTTFIRRRKVVMRQPLLAGDRIRSRGWVSADRDGSRDLKLVLSTDRGDCVRAEATIDQR